MQGSHRNDCIASYILMSHTFNCRPLNNVSSNFNALSTDSLLENSMYANLKSDNQKVTISIKVVTIMSSNLILMITYPFGCPVILSQTMVILLSVPHGAKCARSSSGVAS